MEKGTKSPLFGTNPFSAAFTKFDEEAFFSNLHNKIRDKPYFEQYKGFKATLLWLSYLFNVASALTASYAVYWLVHRLTGIALAGWLVALVFLFFLEKVKRKSSSEFWQVWFFRKQMAMGWLFLSLFCLAISLLSSGFGVKQGTETLSPTLETLKADSMATFYYSEVQRLEKVNEALRSNKNSQGMTFYKLYESINANTLTIADYRKRAQALEEKLDGKNEQLSESYQAEIKMTAWTMVWITLLMELLFEACLCYVWYYYYRSYVERNTIHKKYNVHTNDIQSNEIEGDRSPALSALEKQLETLRTENETLRRLSAPPPLEMNGSEIENRTPIGFHNNKPKAAPKVCADVGRAGEGVHTVAHTYIKNGERITVHYTMTNIKSRIAQYQRDLEEAINRGMKKSVIENRRIWLGYWEGKKEELVKRQEEGSMLEI